MRQPGPCGAPTAQIAAEAGVAEGKAFVLQSHPRGVEAEVDFGDVHINLGGVLLRQEAEGWGTRVIDRLATDLRAAFPQMKGVSRSNPFHIRYLAPAWPLEAIVQQPVLGTPGTHPRC